MTDDDIWLTKAADVTVGDTITTLFSDTGEARVVALCRVEGRIMAELDNGRSTYLGGDDDIVEVVSR